MVPALAPTSTPSATGCASPALITRDFNGSPLTFRSDGWFNMTKAAQHFGKRLDKFWETRETRDYMDALASAYPTKTGDKDYVQVLRGNGNLPSVGTFAHPKLAVFFARWLDVRFAVWCDAVIEDIQWR